MGTGVECSMIEFPALPGGISSLQQLHQLILKAAGEGIYGLDCDGRATFANEAAVRILGWKEEEIIGQHKGEYCSRFCSIISTFIVG